MLLLQIILAGTAAAAATPQGAGAQPVFGGADVRVAVERASGRIAVSGRGVIEIFANVTETMAIASFAAPAPDAQVTEYKGHTLLLWHPVPDNSWGGDIVLNDDGTELTRWTNEKQHFPNTSTHLTQDGTGLIGSVWVDSRARAEQRLPTGIPDRTNLMITKRFSDGVRKLLSPGLLAGAEGQPEPPRIGSVDMIGLTPDDVVASLSDGVVMRLSSGRGLFETKVDEVPRASWVITDVDVARGVVVLVEQHNLGTAVGVDINTGHRLWRWNGPEKKGEIDRFLGQTRGSNALGRWLSAVEKREMPMKPSDADSRKARATALVRLYGVMDARLLPDGRLLVAGGSAASDEAFHPWMGVVDAATGELAGRELLDRMAARGGTKAADFIRSRKVPRYLAWWVLPDGTLLVRGADGYYRVGVTD